MLYLTAGVDVDTRLTMLTPCSGRRDESSTRCAEGCVGHHDRYASDDEPHTANEILYWLPKLPGARLANSWTWQTHPCINDERFIRLIEHRNLFTTGKGVAVPIWVLVVDNQQYDEQSYALAFTDKERATEAFSHEVEEAEGACDC